MPRRLLVLVASCLAAMAPAHPPPAAPLRAYVGASVLDVRTGTARPATLVTRGERIEAVLPPSAPLPAGAERVDVGGLHAIPGLIDVHQHLAIGQGRRAAEAALRRELYSGVTAVRDMGGDARILADLARAARLGEFAGSDVYFAGLFAGPGFFVDDRMAGSAAGETPGKVPWLRAVDAATDLRLAIAEVRGTGASGLKIYGNLEAPLVERIAAEAKRQGVPVWAHAAVFPASPREVAEAGADSMSHVCMIAYQSLQPPPVSYHNRAPLDEAALDRPQPHPAVVEVLEAMRARGMVLDTTLWVYREIERMRREMKGYKPPIYCSSALAERLAAQAHRAGVPLAAGTDAPAKASSPYPALFDELDLLDREAGLGRVEALRTATVNAARALGREAEMGSLDSGKLANVAFLSADPLAAGAPLRSVVLTVKRGKPHWRRDYVPVTAAELDE